MKHVVKTAVWRSRAVAIIGFLIMFLVVFPGLPSALENTLFMIFGLLVFAFGFAGSRHQAYEPENKVTKPIASLIVEEQVITAAPTETNSVSPTEDIVSGLE